MTGATPSDLAGAAVVGGAFLAVLVAAEAWARVGRPDPEGPRKAVHLGGGLAVLFFPFLVESPAVVAAMAATLTGLFLLSRRRGLLRCLHGVSRPSRGAEYYPLAIALAFLLAQGRPWLYVTSVLVLALADTLAALIGSRLGRVRFAVGDARKSLEGSLAFLLAAFLSAAIPALLGSGLPRAHALLAALHVALLVTGFEIICRRGSDNLFIPLAVCVILDRDASKTLAELGWQTGSILALAAVLGAASWWTRAFEAGSAIALLLFTYAAWSLFSPAWALPAFVGIAAFIVRRTGRAFPNPPTGAVAVSRALVAPFLVLSIAYATGAHGFLYGPYLAACAATLAFSLWGPGGSGAPPSAGRRPLEALGAGAVAYLLIGWLPSVLAADAETPAKAALAAIALAVALVHDRLQGRARGLGPDLEWSAGRFLLTLAAAAATAALQWAGAVNPWRPAA